MSNTLAPIISLYLSHLAYFWYIFWSVYCNDSEPQNTCIYPYYQRQFNWCECEDEGGAEEKGYVGQCLSVWYDLCVGLCTSPQDLHKGGLYTSSTWCRDLPCGGLVTGPDRSDAPTLSQKRTGREGAWHDQATHTTTFSARYLRYL